MSTLKISKPKIFSKEPVAIVGLGAILPDAANKDEFWNNVINGKNSIQEVPVSRWDSRLYYDEDKTVPDKTYSKIGAFVKEIKFSPIDFRIPPSVIEQIDPVQQMAIIASKEALEDANYKDKSFPNEKCAVIIGNSMGGEKTASMDLRVFFPKALEAIKTTKEYKNLSKSDKRSFLNKIEEEYKKDMPVINEDSMPGELANIIAGRIASTFGLRGKSMTSDAACASSLAAIDIAYKGLLNHEFDAAVVGGSDRSMGPTTFVKFSKIGALSATGSYPFDARSDGFVMGEGSAIFVLKRLSDAIKAGNKIYALVKGVGASSDGKGKGITAPNPIGQKLAMERAYTSAGIDPSSVKLIEAHGTSTKVGDKIEVNTLIEFFKPYNLPKGSIKLGSVKSQIGHLKSAAGAAGIAKAVLALHNKTIPPSINFETPNPNINWADGPFEIPTQAEKWESGDEPRRAGVSSFGFGGTNFHVILEEYDPATEYESSVEVTPGLDKSFNWDDYVTRNKDLENEVLLISSKSKKDLIAKIREVATEFPETTIMDKESSNPLLTYTGSLDYASTDKHIVGISYKDKNDIASMSNLAIAALNDKDKQSIAQARGVFVSGFKKSKLAFVFPGQGSQYADMMFDLSLKYKVVKDTFDEADGILKEFLGAKLSDYVFSRGRDRKEVEEGLRQTEITQPSLLVADIALFRLLNEFNIRPDMVAGHSLGEYAALVAAGVLSFKDALMAVAIRGRAMSEVDAKDKGTMASITANIKQVERILESVKGYAIAANKNSLTTTVISGSTPGIDEAIKKFEEKGLKTIRLSVSAAFHTKIVEPAAEPLSEYLDSITFNPPQIKITSNVLGDFFPDDPSEIRDIMKKQVGAVVEWTNQTLNMHRAGANTFIEVGPKRALSSFVADILSDESVLSIVGNHPKKGGIKAFNETLAACATLGINIPRISPDSNTLSDLFQWTPRKAAKKASSGELEAYNINLDPVVITGVGVGLPGKHKEVFAEDNFERIFRGENLIDEISDKNKDAQLDKNIRRLIKKSSGAAEFFSPQTYEDVIKLGGIGGKFSLIDEFKTDEKITATFDKATALATAAGLLALRDAGIPLVQAYRKTTTGSFLPIGWELPSELQDDTGVIFASAFPGFNTLTKDMADFYDHSYKVKSKKLLNELYSEINRKMESEDDKKYLLDKLTKELNELDKTQKEFHFNRKILLEVLSMGHAQFAQLIKARGPNTQVNSACASTTLAIGVANDWIRTGRCKRVVIISADDVTTDELFPWLGSGFLASGAASIQSEVKEAAVPFDLRREGMIVGMGAAAFVMETETEADRRGVKPIVEVLGVYYANSAFHGTRLNVDHVSSELGKFLGNVKKTHGLNPEDLAKSMIFMSHETYTPRRGGSASAEIRSLRDNFGELANKILIANTKGFTGHAMGAGIEDAVAIRSLEEGRIPPIANFKIPDPDLGDLQLSKGGKITADYALRLAAGFGSQIAFALYKKQSSGDRYTSQYFDWLTSIGGKKDDLFLEGKSLRLKDQGRPMKGSIIQKPKLVKTSPPPKKIVSAPKKVIKKETKESSHGMIETITSMIAKHTGYPVSMLEDPRMELEEDLGIDSIKQAEIFGEIREEFGVEMDDDLNLAEYQTIEQIANYFTEKTGGEVQVIEEVQTVEEEIQEPVIEEVQQTPTDSSHDEIVEVLTATLVKHTGYPRDMLDDRNLALEEDLGIDSIKQAEVFGEVREYFGIELDEDLNLADYQTINEIANYFGSRGGDPPVKVVSKPIKQEQRSVKETPIPSGSANMVADLTKIIAEKTGYPVDMLSDPNLALEEDLGIDSIKIAEIFGDVREQFGFEMDEDLNITDYQTIAEIAAYFDQKVSSAELVKSEVEAKVVSPKPKEKQKPKEIEGVIDKSILDNIISQVSSLTGYPTSMISEHNSLVNDFGFDSVMTEELKSQLNITVESDFETIGDLAKIMGGGQKLVDKDKDEPEPGKKPVITSKDDVISYLKAAISEKTGYPDSMFEIDEDLEESYGIDSVKAAEIITVAIEKYQAPDLEIDLAEINTIERIADYIVKNAGTADLKTDEMKSLEKIKTKLTHRYVLRSNKSDLKTKFKGYGCIIGRKSNELTSLASLTGLNLKSSIKKIEGQKDGATLVFYNPSNSTIGSISQLFEFLKEENTVIGKLVLIVKPKKIGDNSIHSLNPIQGAMAGMFKAFAMEFPYIRAKIIVVDSIDQVSEELDLEGTEVIFNNGRRVVALSEEDLKDIEWKMPEGSTLVASGGAQGITFEIVKQIASPDSNIILLGRTTIREDAAEIANLSDDEKQQRKMEYMQELRATGEKVTPVILERKWSKIEKSANVYTAIKELENLGCKVYYEPVDIRDRDTVKAIFDRINPLIDNSVDYFIHGAGVEISRPTRSKSLEEFNLVYDVKTQGFENIFENIKSDTIKRIIGFSSVAGRFGNATQVDYSAANEYLTKRCAELSRQGINASTISWSAWADVGMATRGSTMKVLESMGVTAIPKKEGIQRFVSEFVNGTEIEVVISGELGELASKATWFEPDYKRGIMIDKLDVKTSSTSRVLSLKKDKYLDDHRIDGKAVLPGVMGLETMVQTYRAFTGNGVSSVHDIEFQSPVKLPRDKDLEVLTFLKKFGKSADLQLKSKFLGSDGKQLGDLRDHFKSKMVSSKWTPGYPVILVKDLYKLKEQSLMSRDEIYSIFFHGSSYQVLDKLSLITNNAVICDFNQPKKSMFGKKVKLEIDPLAIEAAFQTAGLHLLLNSQIMGLPSGVKMLTLFKAGPPSYIRAYHKSTSDTHSIYDVEVIDAQGVCVIRLDGYEMIHTGTVNKFDIKIKKDGPLHSVHNLAGRIDKNLFLVEVNPLSDVSDQFISRVFTKIEQQKYNQIKVNKKRYEWLAGKIATKLAISYYHKLPINDIEIEKDENKSPYVLLNDKIHVSISHSNGIAMAIVGDEAVDVEIIDNRAESFVKQMFSKKEIAALKLDENDSTTVTKLWSMKEAHLKRMRIGLKTDAKKVTVDLKSDSQGLVSSKEGKSTCNSYKLDNWLITIAEK